jgi:hypothetical protein
MKKIVKKMKKEDEEDEDKENHCPPEIPRRPAKRARYDAEHDYQQRVDAITLSQVPEVSKMISHNFSVFNAFKMYLSEYVAQDRTLSEQIARKITNAIATESRSFFAATVAQPDRRGL